jgi:hypothetical protein
MCLSSDIREELPPKHYFERNHCERPLRGINCREGPKRGMALVVDERIWFQ